MPLIILLVVVAAVVVAVVLTKKKGSGGEPDQTVDVGERLAGSTTPRPSASTPVAVEPTPPTASAPPAAPAAATPADGGSPSPDRAEPDAVDDEPDLSRFGVTEPAARNPVQIPWPDTATRPPAHPMETSAADRGDGDEVARPADASSSERLEASAADLGSAEGPTVDVAEVVEDVPVEAQVVEDVTVAADVVEDLPVEDGLAEDVAVEAVADEPAPDDAVAGGDAVDEVGPDAEASSVDDLPEPSVAEDGVADEDPTPEGPTPEDVTAEGSSIDEAPVVAADDDDSAAPGTDGPEVDEPLGAVGEAPADGAPESRAEVEQADPPAESDRSGTDGADAASEEPVIDLVASEAGPTPEEDPVDLVLNALINRARARHVGVAEVAAELVEQAELEDREVDEVLADLVGWSGDGDDDEVRTSERLSELTLFNDAVPRRPGELSQFERLAGSEKKRVIIRVLCLLVAQSGDRAKPREPRSDAETRGWPLARAVWPVAVEPVVEDPEAELPARPVARSGS